MLRDSSTSLGLSGHSFKRLPRRSETARQRQGCLILLGRAFFVALCLQQSAEHIVRRKQWRLLGRVAGSYVLAHKFTSAWQIPSASQEYLGRFDQDFVVPRGLDRLVQRIFHLVEIAVVTVEECKIEPFAGVTMTGFN